MIPLILFYIQASGVTTRGGWTVAMTTEYEATSAQEAVQWVFEELSPSITWQKVTVYPQPEKSE